MTPNSKMQPGSTEAIAGETKLFIKPFLEKLNFSQFFLAANQKRQQFCRGIDLFASTGSSPESHCLYLFPDRIQPLSVILKVDTVITSRRACLSNRKWQLEDIK